ncbi:MAG: PD-(D/E)XK nuclease family transposase [Candidatus Marithrix sp.]
MEVIPLKYGSMFKRAFSQPDVFCQFSNDILGINIKIDKVHTEYEYPKPIGFVRSKYDLFAEDVEQRIIVEIQQVKADDFFDRFLYYHLISLVEQVGGYQEYEFDRTVYTIVVLTSTPRDGSVNFSCAVSDMNPIDEFGNTVSVYPHRLVFLCPRQVNDKTPEKIKKWLNFIEDSLDGEMDETNYQESLLQKIMKAIHKQSIDPTLLSEIKDEAAWSKAKERFVADGMEKGREEGVLMMAKNMKEAKVAIETIMEVTDLSMEQIESL